MNFTQVITSPPPQRLPRRVARRTFAVLLTLSFAVVPLAMARDGVDVGGNSAFSRLVPADTIERSAGQQYAQMLQQAAAQKALAASDHPQVRRLRSIAKRLIPFAIEWNPRARDWHWEVNLIGSKQINLFSSVDPPKIASN